jgi:hypothetical protein
MGLMRLRLEPVAAQYLERGHGGRRRRHVWYPDMLTNRRAPVSGAPFPLGENDARQFSRPRAMNDVQC